jgi:hypothetical protein
VKTLSGILSKEYGLQLLRIAGLLFSSEHHQSGAKGRVLTKWYPIYVAEIKLVASSQFSLANHL